MVKLDPKERQCILFELEMKTKFSPTYLNGLDNDKLIELYKERCQNG